MIKKYKYKPSEAELVNDPSLQWTCDYKWGEALYSDQHADRLRFIRREGGLIYLASINGIAELPAPVPVLSVRRK